ncbi:MAG: Ig-like domain-containing protein [Gemmataceae bacterium]|nr:Ig-like domain-containing protein [Gemmataceae bacterium]
MRSDRIRLCVESLEDRIVPSNAIVAENQLPGTPESVWGVFQIGDPTLQGFATNMSVNHGQTIDFKITDTTLAPYRVDIYRMGYYGGNGARLVATIPSSQVTRQNQPNPLTNAATGLVDAGNWSVSASWAVPADATSGLYFARPTREDNGGASVIYFVVRADESTSDLLFQTSDTTWQAYNNWGGNSLYEGNPDGRAYKVSYNRPLIVDARGGGLGDYNSPLHSEYPMIRWLERNGYDVSYFSDVDTDRIGNLLLNHEVFLSVGHDEYWSGQQRANVEAARDAGVDLAFFSGNEVYWKVRWESSIDASGTPYRTLVCYKESKNNARIDPLDVAPTWTWTGTWRDTRFSPPSDGGRPENGLTGTLYMNDRTNVDLGISMNVSEADGNLRFWRDTPVANLPPGQTATIGQFVVGYETNEDLDNGFRPAGLMTMSSTSFTTQSHVIVPWGTETGPGSSTHKITLYKAPSGALVFSAGSVQWSWGLDGNHKNGPTVPDPSMQQATVNLFADMGVQPASLQSGLVAATASTDSSAPTSSVTSPPAGTELQVGTPVTITGTAAENGSGVLGGVEVSTDNGVTWHPVVGKANWTYQWNPTVSGPTFIRSRAVDDSGNIEIPSAGVNVTVSSSNTLVAALGFDEGAGGTTTDASGKGNNGSLNATTWAAGKYGTGLSFNGNSSWVTVNDSASLDLTGAMTLEAWVNPESLSGWDTVIMKETAVGMAYTLYANDNAPRPAGYIHNNTQGDLSAVGSSPLALNTWSHLAMTYDGANLRLYVNAVQVGLLPVVATAVTSNNPLRIGGNVLWGEYFDGLIDEVRIYNRVLAPSEILTDMNTPVSLDTTPPTVTVVSPTAGASGVAPTNNVTATFSEAMTPGTISAATVELRDPGNNLVSAAVSYDVATRTATLDPNATLELTTAYTARVKGGSGGVKDLAGNALVSDFTWTFTTAAAPPPPSLSINNASVSEGNSGTTTAGFTVTLSASSSQTVTVQYATANGSASAGSDYVATSGTLTFTPGQTTRPIAVTVNGDTTVESDETFTVSLSNPTNATIAQGVGTGTITNDDAPPATGLVVALGFKEGAGTTTADVSGTGNNGTLNGATWTTAGKYGNALSFNGTSNYVTVADANSLDLTTGMTLEAWVRPTSLSGWTTAILKERPSGLAYSLYVSDDTGRPPAGYIFRSGSDVSVIGTSAVPLNTWTHLTTTYDGANLRLYVNGVQAATRAVTGAITASANALRIGGNTIWGEYFSGLLDEIRVYNRALTAGEIQTDMNTPVDGADTTSPTVSVTSPATGAMVSGTISVTANASDNVGVAGVQFLLDGANLGAEDTSAPYSVSWNTLTSSEGSHTLSARARDAAGNVTTSAPVSVTVSNADTTAPAVAITTPSAGSTITGATTVSANASDNVGVVGVQFLLDGLALGTEDATAPYSVAWDSATATNGSHTLTARARDAAGNESTSAGVTVTVSNSVESQIGEWSPVQNWPLVAMNSVVLKDGRVLVWDGGPDCIGSTSARVWNPATNTFTPVPLPYFVHQDDDIFCSAQVVLADGRVLVVGGHDCDGPQLGIKMVNIFDPDTMTWTRGPDMAYRRWYPTATLLADGRVLVTAGSVNNTLDYVPIPEMYDPVSNTWTTLTAANQTIPNYPFVFQTPDGRVLVAGSDEAKMATYILDVATQSWSLVDPTVLDGGSAVMYAPGQIMKAGSSYLSAPADNGGNIPSAATTYVLDATLPTPAWQQTASMANPRTHLNLTVLPDGTVLATGGSTDIGGINPATGVLPAELWNPATQTWTTMASMARAREYHSTAFLLPDARVVVTGSGHNFANSYAEFSAETYSPAYLFKGARPTVTTAPAQLGYASSFFVGTPDGADIASVVLIRNGAVTHSFNMEQRYVPLSFTQTTGGLNIDAPANSNLAPPGYYMLFLVNGDGVPSVAPIVRLPAPTEDAEPPTAPGGFTANDGIGQATLSWSPSTDNVGVTNYNVHRSTAPGFTPTTANRIAQPTTTSFVDSGLSAGTYYYVVTAQDARGNVSLPSSEDSATVTIPDTTPPSVNITSPAGAATVSGTIAVSANASDNIGVAGVQFLLDGNNLGAEDITAPFSISWTTTTATNGTHNLTARARDAAGNTTTSAVVSVTVSNSAPTGLVLALSFNASSGATATDTSGLGNNGTVSGATWSTTGKYGNALSFDGTNDLVTVPDAASLDLTTGMTLEAWVRPTTINGWETVILKEAPGELAYALYADNNGNDSGGPRRPAGWIRQGSTSYGTAGTAQLAVNTWTHLASTYDGAALRLFVNGVQVSSLARSGSMLVTGNPLRVGGNNVWSEWFNGLIDEVRVYNRALTAAEITTDMNTPINGGFLHLDVAAVVPGPHTEPLTEEMMTPVVNEAIARWVATGTASQAALEAVPVQITDLPGNELGFTSATGVLIDRDAAGFGWFVDPTPADDSEFSLSHGPAYMKVDLLTVLAHELGHVLGLDDNEPGGDLMAGTVPLGVRRLPTPDRMAHHLEPAPQPTALPAMDVAALHLVHPKAPVATAAAGPIKKVGAKLFRANLHVAAPKARIRSHKNAQAAKLQPVKTSSLLDRLIHRFIAAWSRGGNGSMTQKPNRP